MYTCIFHISLLQKAWKMIRVYGQFRSFNIQMFHSSLIVIVLSSAIFHVEAQNFDPNFPIDNQSNFQPNLAVVVSILALMFALTFILLVYAKCCNRRTALVGNNNHQETAAISASSRFSGIDKAVIEALPFFRFSSLKGSKEGLECVVCLSKFEDIELLRMLPKCKHAFHINCIDYWLEKHSSCPLCRHKVSSEDLAFTAYSNSMRVLWNSQSEHRQDSNIEVFVEREADQRSSSRFSIGSSFRKTVIKEDELLIQAEDTNLGKEDQKILHKHKHKIIVSDFEFKSRWSNVSSSDLMFLSSEMLNTESSNRFSSRSLNNEQFSSPKAMKNEDTMHIMEDMEMKRLFKNEVGTAVLGTASNSNGTSAHVSSSMNQGEKRSMSDVIGFSRFGNLGFKNRTRDPSLLENNVNEKRTLLWLPIARKTVQWFVNREKRPQQPQQPLDV